MSIVEFEDEASIQAAIADLKADGSATDWVTLGYAGPKAQKVMLVGSGSGGIDEMKDAYKEDVVCYSLVRVTDQIDDSVTVKFAFINWIGEKTPRLQKARISVHRGGVTDFVGQFHVDQTSSDLSEISAEITQKKVMDASGSASHILDSAGVAESHGQAKAHVSKSPAIQRTKSVPVEKGGGLELVDEAALKEALSNVRSDKSDVDWCLFQHPEGAKIVLAGSGNDGVAGLKGHLTDDSVYYGLVRKMEMIDDSETIKFAFINWAGESTPRMHKARLGTYKGAVQDLFNPFHVDINPTEVDEVSDQIIVDLIGTHSGTKTNVMDSTVEAGFYHK